jgi:hypothetical protein
MFVYRSAGDLCNPAVDEKISWPDVLLEGPEGFSSYRFQTGYANQATFLPTDLKTIRCTNINKIWGLGMKVISHPHLIQRLNK